jgi:hypothetical protein
MHLLFLIAINKAIHQSSYVCIAAEKAKHECVLDYRRRTSKGPEISRDTVRYPVTVILQFL